MNEKERRLWDLFTIVLWGLFYLALLREEENPVKYIWMSSPLLCWLIFSVDLNNGNLITQLVVSVYAAACLASFAIFVVKGE